MPSVHTSTYELVLAPIAQAVGELVVIEEEAVQHKSPFPDMTATGSMIAKSTAELIKIATRVKATTTDRQTQDAMTPAMVLCEESAKQFVESTVALRDNPRNEEAAASLSRAAKALLDGTSRVLQAFDDNEVRRILAICDRALEQIAILAKVNTIPELAASLKPAVAALVDVAKATDRRATELTSLTVQNQLLSANEVIKTCSPNIVSSIKLYCTTRSSQTEAEREKSDMSIATRSSKEFVTDRVRDAVLEIRRIMQLKFVYDEDIDDAYVIAGGVVTSGGASSTAATAQTLQFLQGGAGGKHGANRQMHTLAVKYGEQLALFKAIQEGLVTISHNVLRQDKAKVLENGMKLEADCEKVSMKAMELDVQSRNVSAIGNSFGGSSKALNKLGAGENGSLLQTAISQLAQARREMMSSATQVADDTSDEASRRELQAKVAHMSEKASQLEVLATAQAMENATMILQELHSPLREMINAAHQGNPPAHGLASDRFKAVSVQLGKSIQTTCAYTSDPERAKRLDQRCAALLKLVPELQNATRAVAVINHDIEAQRNKNNAAVVAAVRGEGDAETSGSGGQGSSESTIGAAANGPAASHQVATLRGTEDTQNLLKKAAVEHMDTMKAEWDRALAALERVLDDVAAPNSMFDVLADDLKNHQLADFIAAVESGDQAKFDAALNALNERVSHIIIQAKSEAARTGNAEFIKTVDRLCEALEKSRDHLVQTGREALLNPTAENKAAFNKAQHQFALAVTNIEIALRSKPAPGEGEDGLPSVPRHKVMDQIDQIFRRMAPVPKPVVQFVQPDTSQMDKEAAAKAEAEAAARRAAAEAEAAALAAAAAAEDDVESESEEEEEEEQVSDKLQQIKDAAKELRAEARKWSSKGNDLIALANELAQLMLEMADHAHHFRKAELVRTAKLMCAKIVEIERIAREIAKNCPDKRLSKQLLDYVDRVPTISNQLRVISSVKAANPNDAETDSQLVVCARNLMTNVTHVVNRCEAACVARQQIVGDSNAPKTGPKLQWKRRLTTKRSSSKDAVADA
ncbi:hypothetical protein CAOG_03344 [Capsaspora owczarzaki ATCC 30864]|uniref:Vinculin n=1 Tax=Capsaspora owczarzaki (strain ATCC 30864) TaxID=595528 RepID=A0A0D2UBD6_CAPO3|nr:hypothetical protein CAOG_03344 [Capsaspora owczarzaki ATCC 30864]KJE92361.1 hypothetical protein CAOG_003344 [Capsaspora owczarzaki ATCC 30864]|eukprot:XP_004364183.1 hypothetical protein CAOG_03344 [Capsaspora owczarzaki ATCC 30864]